MHGAVAAQGHLFLHTREAARDLHGHQQLIRPGDGDRRRTGGPRGRRRGSRRCGSRGRCGGRSAGRRVRPLGAGRALLGSAAGQSQQPGHHHNRHPPTEHNNPIRGSCRLECPYHGTACSGPSRHPRAGHR
ncbi:hypothetical protein CP983_38740 [Streptomyces chartreusis]|nr:hypothetical protein CP983_38740 [Streptomyces chartreusis]